MMRWPWQPKYRPPFDETDRLRTLAVADMDVDSQPYSPDLKAFIRKAQKRARERIAAYPDEFRRE